MTLRYLQYYWLRYIIYNTIYGLTLLTTFFFYIIYLPLLNMLQDIPTLLTIQILHTILNVICITEITYNTMY